MKVWPLISLLSTVLAFPTGDQIILGNGLHGDLVDSATAHITKGAADVLHGAGGFISAAKKQIHKWEDAGKEFVKQNGLVYEFVSHPEFSNYKLRLTEPKLCDAGVKQYSGYLDIAEDKHLFFWFFEARFRPDEAPLVLWLNGGPGCSSSTGLLFELGPCNIADGGRSTTRNQHSWNTHANMIFLDQPVNVGYSYADDGTTVNNSPVAGQDVYAFLELFLNRFSKYSHLPFHIAAESYGGIYAPNIASVIHKENQALSLAPNPRIKKINLASVILANGLTNPYIQYGSIADYACEGPFPVYPDPDGPQCTALRTKEPTCQRLVQACYNFNSKLACVPAQLYCNSQLFGPLSQLGLNLYDVRKKCDKQKDKDGPLCYQQMGWIETWMNNPENKAALGVDPSRDFESCNMEVNQAFTFQGDGAHNSALLLPDLVNDGVRLLVYAGNADMMCNYIGNERWVEALESKFQDEFAAAESTSWVTRKQHKVAGTVRTAGGNGFTAGNVTFVTVFDAGHMVPFDQPEAALDLITRWIYNIPLN
jgi:cathepsin A (carboxypeptidase C)